MYEQRKLGEILVNLQILKSTDVDRILTALHRRVDRQKFGQMGISMGLMREEHILAALAVQMDLCPGIQNWTLHQILRCLQTPTTPASPVQAAPQNSLPSNQHA